MSGKKAGLLRAAAAVAVIAVQFEMAKAADSPVVGQVSEGEIVVTAQKRQQNIQDVGVSITAVGGDKLIQLGIVDTQQLQKIIPGFVFTPTLFGTNVFTIRGVGSQIPSLAVSPTVSVYESEAPLPYSALSVGATLDLKRVEVLKGPQGTLFGQNATGGAINYIANLPTDSFTAGGDVTIGRFGTANVQGFISGPISHRLSVRLALQSNNSGAWQTGYGPQRGQEIGGTDLLNGRLSLLWRPTDKFKALLTLNGWRDKGYSQEPQSFLPAAALGAAPPQLSPAIANYPVAPHDNRAAGFNQCINTDPYDPIAGQSAGTTYPAPNGTPISEGLGSVVQSGGQAVHCVPPRRNDKYFNVTLRVDYDLPSDIVATSLTSYQKFRRKAGVDISGSPFQIFEAYQTGHIDSIYEELRLAGKIHGKGAWVIGGNYQHDDTVDKSFESYQAESSVPVALPTGTFALGPNTPYTSQKITTLAAFANAEYPILKNLSLVAGARYTRSRNDAQACFLDGGDGTWSHVEQQISNLLEFINGTISQATYLSGGGFGVDAGPGGCATLGPGPLYQAFVTTPHFKLNENNISWRSGVNWKVQPDKLLYVSVSRGYKAGAFSDFSAATYQQLAPVVQESLLSYEAGFKTQLLDKTLTFDGALFYYDYSNKQIQGSFPNQLFGPIPALVNIPKSHVIGFELSGSWRPRFLNGLTIAPSVSYQKTRVDSSSRDQCPTLKIAGCIPGHYYNFDAYSAVTDFTGKAFPQTPKLQAVIDAEYDWTIKGDLTAFVGGNVSHTGSTDYFFTGSTPAIGNPFHIDSYTLLDLRAGIAKDKWRLQVFGRNVTNKYYWTTAFRVPDAWLRFTGSPPTYGMTVSYRY